jgi:tape measure domain-containing protein
MVSGFIQANKAIQSTRLALEAVFESGQQAAESMAWLDSLADRLGLSVSVLNEQFVLLAASTKGTALEGQATRDIFESVVASMAKLGRTAEETNRALIAVSQMASKGTVAMEELRGQLGEALPGAMQAMAKGLGLTVQQLGDLVATGKLAAKDALPALKKGLDETFSLKADDRINSLTASIERFWNAVNRSFTQTGEAGLSGALGTIIDSAGTVVSVLSTQTVAIGRMSAAVAAYASGAIGSLAELEAELQRIQQDAMERAFGAIPAFDPNAPPRPKGEKERSLTEAGPTQKFTEELNKRRQAAKSSTELELEIWRQYSRERSALSMGDEAEARKAQEAQESALLALVKAGASKAMTRTYEDLVGRMEKTAVEIKAKTTIEIVNADSIGAQIQNGLKGDILQVTLDVTPRLNAADFDGYMLWTSGGNGEPPDVARDVQKAADAEGANP